MKTRIQSRLFTLKINSVPTVYQGRWTMKNAMTLIGFRCKRIVFAEPTKVARGTSRFNRTNSEYLGLKHWILQVKFSCSSYVGSGRYQAKVLKLAKRK